MYGVCKCFEGYAGASCADIQCEDPCNGHGECLNEECFCEPGWGGFKCSEGIFIFTYLFLSLFFVEFFLNDKQFFNKWNE